MNVDPAPRPISDFGLYHIVDAPYRAARPTSVAEVCEVVRDADRLCVRGGGHSLNGGGVPREGETMLDTSAADGRIEDLDLEVDQ